MATHIVGTINPDYALLGDTAPVAIADTASVAYNQSVTIDVLGNDTDSDVLTQDQQFLGVGEYTDPVIAGTNTPAAGHLQVINNQFIFTADDPSFANGSTDITFSYTAVDQWGAESNWTTVTVHVTGNSTPGIHYCGTVHNDIIHDGGGNDYLYGNNGDDLIYSTTGNDVLNGGNGKDQLFAGSGNDVLIGGNGNDVLHAGSGVDILSGGDNSAYDCGCFNMPGSHDNGAGKDTFILPSDFSTVTITDFKSQNDTIKISPWVFQSFSQMMTHATQQGCNVVISTADQFDPANTHTLILQHTSLQDLHAKDFLFV